MSAQFNPKYGIFTDEGGLMVPKGDVLALLTECAQHLQHSEAELEALASRIVHDVYPSMETQVNWDYYK